MPVFTAIARIFTPSKATGQSGAQYNEALNALSRTTPVVDPATARSNVGQLGRAALISTSPQGVSGTDPSLRYKLLGNSSDLGN